MNFLNSFSPVSRSSSLNTFPIMILFPLLALISVINPSRIGKLLHPPMFILTSYPCLSTARAPDILDSTCSCRHFLRAWAILFLRVASSISSSDNGKYKKNGENEKGYFFATMGVLRKPMFSTQASMTSPGLRKLSGFVFPSAPRGEVSKAVPEQVPAQIMSPG